MRRYAEIRPEEPEEPEIGKQEDTSLPQFSKEIPFDTRRKENKGIVSIQYGWSSNNSTTLKVKYIEFHKGEKHLENVFKIYEYDGIDRSSLHFDDTIYMVRKTSSKNAKNLFSESKNRSSCVERIVGYLLTLGGSTYIVSRVNNMCWIFDEQLAKKLHTNMKFINIDDLSDKQKAQLCRMVIEKLTELHSERILFGRPVSVKNILMTTNSLVLIDLRDLKKSKKNSHLVEEFRRTMAEMLDSEMATQGEVFHAIAHYLSAMESACREWHKEKTGKKKTDALCIAAALEDSLYN